MKSALILYPNQLFAAHDLPKVETVVMIEDPLLFGMDQQFPRRLHKQKLILHRASMQRYVEEVLWPAGYKTEYIDLDVFMSSGDVFDTVKKAEQIFIFDPTDDELTKRLLQKRREDESLPPVNFLTSPNFYLKEQEVRQYFGERHKKPFDEFYQWQRERFNILIDDDYKPVGGKWNLSEQKQEQGGDVTPPSFASFGDNKWVHEATAWVEEHFPDNPGSSEFMWPTNHAEAELWLQDFLEHRLDNFGAYQATIDSKSPWMFHSLLSSSLNIGLLKPQEVVKAALERNAKRPVQLGSLESFIRLVIGWREYMRGLYLQQAPQLREANSFGHKRKLTTAWYNGTTGLPPLDDLIKKLQTHAYGHQAERHNIAANLMILCEIHPDSMHKWFSELFIDNYDWVVTPDIYSLHQAIDGLHAVTAPCISPSNYILEMSDYERGIWSDVWDGLFWRFVEKHETVMSKNPHLRVMVQRLHRLDADHKRIITYRAEDFLNQHTTL